MASGDDMANTCNGDMNAESAECGSTWRGFDQLTPTNHIHFGYMDRMAWKNMIHWAVNLQMRPTKNSHLDIAGHFFRLNNTKDNWYGAAQTVFVQTPNQNTQDDLGEEIDVVYTQFFGAGNHVAWQIGGGAFFAGDFITGQPITVSHYNDAGVGTETWGYTQLWINW